MKKVVLALLCSFFVISAQAQENLKGFSVWYGINYASLSVEHQKTADAEWEMKPVNFGVNWQEVDKSWTYDAGLGIKTKGGKEWSPMYLQLDLDGFWNFVKKDNYRLGIGVGAYAGVNLYKDDSDDLRTFDGGVIGGIEGAYDRFTLRVGFDGSIIEIVKDSKTHHFGIFARIGYTIF